MRAALALVLLAATCRQDPAPQPPPPQPPPDATPIAPQPLPDTVFIPPVGSACQQACAALEWIGCPESRPRVFPDGAAGESCEQACLDGQKIPGLAPNPVRIALCRDVDCARDAGVRCR